MPADEIEVHEGAEEGIHLHNPRGPRELSSAMNGKVTGAAHGPLHVGVRRAAAGSIRRSTRAEVEDIPADTVIFAIGQTSDLSFLDPADGVETRARADQGESRDVPDDRAGCVRVRRYRARSAAVHRRDRVGADRGPVDARFSARHAHRNRGAQAVDARRLHDGGGLERASPRENPPVLESERRAASLDDRRGGFLAKTEARRQARAACGATSTRCSTRRSASPATAAWTCVPENLIRAGRAEQVDQDERWRKAVARTSALTEDELRAMVGRNWMHWAGSC